MYCPLLEYAHSWEDLRLGWVVGLPQPFSLYGLPWKNSRWWNCTVQCWTSGGVTHAFSSWGVLEEFDISSLNEEMLLSFRLSGRCETRCFHWQIHSTGKIPARWKYIDHRVIRYQQHFSPSRECLWEELEAFINIWVYFIALKILLHTYAPFSTVQLF